MSDLEIENFVKQYQRDQQKPLSEQTKKCFIPCNIQQEYLLELLWEKIDLYGVNVVCEKLKEL